MARKKTAQAPSVLATTTVLPALIVNERYRPIAMVVSMRVVAHNGTELARWTGTSPQSQLVTLLCSPALCHSCSCRSTVHSWSAESAPGLCIAPPARSRPRERMCLTARQEPDCTVADFFVNRIVSLTSKTKATICFFFQVSLYNQRCCRCGCVVCHLREERDGRHASLAWQSAWTLLYRESIFVPRFFLCLHQQRQRPVFLQLSLSLSLSLSLHRSLRLA